MLIPKMACTICANQKEENNKINPMIAAVIRCLPASCDFGFAAPVNISNPPQTSMTKRVRPPKVNKYGNSLPMMPLGVVKLASGACPKIAVFKVSNGICWFSWPALQPLGALLSRNPQQRYEVFGTFTNAGLAAQLHVSFVSGEA